MVTGTEQTAASKLENVLKGQASEEQEQEVSEETTAEVETEQETEEGKSAEASQVTFTPAQETEIQRRIDSERDKHTNSYREKHESDTALIRSLNERLKEYKTIKEVSAVDRIAKAILDGDEEDGLPEDKIEAHQKALQDIRKIAEKYAGVEEASDVLEKFASELPKDIVTEFNLFNPNIATRVKGMTDLVSDAVRFQDEKAAIKVFLEEIPVLQKGSEVRQQLESFISDYVELSTKKARDLLVEKVKRDMNVTPRRKPPASSDASGGQDRSKWGAREKVAFALRQDQKKGIKVGGK